jgi:hypothetical protein
MMGKFLPCIITALLCSSALAGSVEDLLKVVRGKEHPYLLGSPKEAIGWVKRANRPWNDFWSNTERAVKANKAVVFFVRGPRTGAILHAGGRAHEGEMMPDPSIPGLLWWATREKEWLERAKRQLEGIAPKFGRDARTGETEVLARFLIRYSMLFDWVAKDLSGDERRRAAEKLADYARLTAKEYMRSRNSHRRIMLGSALGVASLALANEGVPEDELRSWLRLATVGLFEDDPHGWPEGLKPFVPRGALGGVVNFGGYCRIGGYRSYWTGLLAKWMLVYFLATGRNPFDDFPVSRTMLEPLWLSMSTRHSPQGNTRFGCFEHDFLILWPLMSEHERAALRWYLEHDPLVPDRPRFTYGDVWNGPWWALFYPPPMPKRPIPWRSFYDPRGEVCVFRQDWSREALWLAFYAFSYPIPSHREMCHNDNMSFEMFALGDYLVCDPGEVKGRMRGYGPVMGHGHNVLLIDGVAPAKEDITERYYEFASPARFLGTLLCDWFEAALTEMTVNAVEADPLKVVVVKGGRELTARRLKEPVIWRRAVLFPERGYFVVVDNVRCDEAHDYSFLLHLSSLRFKPTVRGKPGYVLGELRIGGKPVNWTRGETLTGERQWIWLEETDGVVLDATWLTESIYSKKVWLKVLSVPKGKVRLGRMWGHIPQCRSVRGESPEVDHPLLAVTNRARRNLWRITLLYPTAKPPAVRYSFGGDGERGLALLVEHDGVRDLLLAGEVEFHGARFEGFCGFLRLKGNTSVSAGGVQCRALKYGGKTVFRASEGVKAFALRFSPQPMACISTEGHVSVKTSLPDREAMMTELPRSTYLLMRGRWRPKSETVKSLASFSVPERAWLVR